MLEDKAIIEVENRDSGSVGYEIPDLGNLSRHFQSGETKKVTMEELRKLSYIRGGDAILRNCLLIHNDSAVAELLGKVEPEYNYGKAEIKKLLIEGSLEQLQDCLNFAPEGVLDLVKQLAVELQINDINKRDLIQSKLGFNVTQAININEQSKKPDEIAPETPKRAAKPITTATTTRMAQPIK